MKQLLGFLERMRIIETITIGASLLQSFMPETADKIVKQLNTELRSYEDMDTFGLYPDNNKLEKPEMLFARLDSDAILEKVEEIRAAQIAESGEPEYPQVEAKPEITIDDVDKVQLRVGEVIVCFGTLTTKYNDPNRLELVMK